ncbi:beta-ketoacyl-[acyl-carrier-protein] synthase family protein [Edaphobacillus lindanitolerans]|uniref:Stage V sporulation protein AD n=1 Tax=Edaphobacillus lindanitolerans TaxID=550447 RepID=A0A1U7PHM4_9BACI|nr:stage V sporulation protein AD [Edaphobacillus lindanitolerans]SIT68671.1 stage V sporulation protein AD [Edaphobacillus lindanitolerans]
MVARGVLSFSGRPSIRSAAVAAGPLEKKKSRFAHLFDQFYDSELCGEETNEKAHSRMIEDACGLVLEKAEAMPADADFLLCGDLVNQMTPSNFAAANLHLPYIGLFSACATSVSSLIAAALLTEAGASRLTLAGSSSQHNAIERQFRYPIEYGFQKGPTAQWTVTAAGFAAVTPNEPGYPEIRHATVGRSVDYGLTDPLNMGAAMAPAAFDTLNRHLSGTGNTPDDYDAIITGDLGSVGSSLFRNMAKDEGIEVKRSKWRDAGEEFYGDDPSFFAGASGAGCSAAVYFSDVFKRLMDGEYRRVLLIATGALLSPLSFQQGDTIPCTAHSVELVMGEGGES